MGESLQIGLRSAGFRGRLEAGEPLARHTTWRIGGPAELLGQPLDRDDLALAVRWARGAGIPWRILGNGSNLLIRDEGVAGLVLRLRRVLDQVRLQGSTLSAGAGASFPSVARRAAAAGLAGIEFGAGIPGTIGGAIVMNAGWHEHEIGNSVRRVEILAPDGSIRWIPGAGCEFSYRHSRFQNSDDVILQAELALRSGDPAEISRQLECFAESRKRNQPTELPSCGSVFVQPPGDFAGRLIDRAGLKGTRVGDIEVSRLHANFFVNHGQGRSADVLELVELVQREVERRFGVRLQREFEIW